MDAPELTRRCDAYFSNCDEDHRKYTRMGLAAALETDSVTLAKWEKDKTLAAPLRQATDRIRDSLEQRTDSMALFLLKQPFYGGYCDKPLPPDKKAGDCRLTVKVTFGDGAEDYGG